MQPSTCSSTRVLSLTSTNTEYWSNIIYYDIQSDSAAHIHAHAGNLTPLHVDAMGRRRSSRRILPLALRGQLGARQFYRFQPTPQPRGFLRVHAAALRALLAGHIAELETCVERVRVGRVVFGLGTCRRTAQMACTIPVVLVAAITL